MDDIELIKRIATGDAAACRALVERHKSYAFTIAYRVLRHRENAEEAAQDAFVQAFKNLSSFNQEAKFTTWFYRIVFNAALMMKRRQKEPADDVDTARHVAADNRASDETKQNEQRFYITKALAKLSPEDATVLTLFYLKEQSLDEIAEVTGMSLANAKVRLHRARQRLANEMSGLLRTEARDLL
jgi:RNA polymerase sigma-70 factor (ECF subfamily)